MQVLDFLKKVLSTPIPTNQRTESIDNDSLDLINS